MTYLLMKGSAVTDGLPVEHLLGVNTTILNLESFNTSVPVVLYGDLKSSDSLTNILILIQFINIFDPILYDAPDP